MSLEPIVGIDGHLTIQVHGVQFTHLFHSIAAVAPERQRPRPLLVPIQQVDADERQRPPSMCVLSREAYVRMCTACVCSLLCPILMASCVASSLVPNHDGTDVTCHTCHVVSSSLTHTDPSPSRPSTLTFPHERYRRPTSHSAYVSETDDCACRSTSLCHSLRAAGAPEAGASLHVCHTYVCATPHSIGGAHTTHTRRHRPHDLSPLRLCSCWASLSYNTPSPAPRHDGSWCAPRLRHGSCPRLAPSASRPMPPPRPCSLVEEEIRVLGIGDVEGLHKGAVIDPRRALAVGQGGTLE